MFATNHVLEGYVFSPPMSGQVLDVPRGAMLQFSLRRQGLKGEGGGDSLEVKCAGGWSGLLLEAINPQTKEVLSLRAKMTCNHSYCQRSFNPARKSIEKITQL